MSKPPPTSTPSRPTTQTKLGRFKNFFFFGLVFWGSFCFVLISVFIF